MCVVDLPAAATTFNDAILQFKAWIATRITWLDVNMPGQPCILATKNNFTNNQNTDHLQVFPNPANDKTTIIFNTKESENQTLNIYDFTGKLVFSTTIQPNIGLFLH